MKDGWYVEDNDEDRFWQLLGGRDDDLWDLLTRVLALSVFWVKTTSFLFDYELTIWSQFVREIF